MGKLQQKKLEHSKPESKEVRLSDGDGLFFRMRPTGGKSWIYYFRLPKNRALHQMTLGSFEDVSLKQARDMLPDLRKLIKQGLDPRQVKAAQITENSQAITMQSLFDAWIEFLESTKNVIAADGSIKNVTAAAWIKAHEGRWNLHLKNSLGSILAKDITRAHLSAALDTMARKGIKEETRKALTTLNLILDYGLTRHIIEQNVARVLKPKDFCVSANQPRDRVLSLPELRKLWVTLDEATKKREGIAKTSSLSIITATAIKLLILTGARRGEVAAMRWDEVDTNAGTWEIVSQKTKNRKAHTIFLSPLAIELIETLKTVTGKSTFIFDTGLNSNGHIHTDALTRSLRRLMKKDTTKNIKSKNKKIKSESNNPPLADMKSFTVHDIRRSVATACGEYLKVKPHVIERMLNHQPLNRLVRTYQRAMYLEEQKAAWLAWGAMVEHQIAKEHSNIVPIKNVRNA